MTSPKRSDSSPNLAVAPQTQMASVCDGIHKGRKMGLTRNVSGAESQKSCPFLLEIGVASSKGRGVGSQNPRMLRPQYSLVIVVAGMLLCSANALIEVSTSEQFITAVGSASSGEEIRIQAGLYTGVCGIQLSQDLTIVGVGQVQLDCESQSSHLFVHGNAVQVSLTNLEFVNGFSDTDGGCLTVSENTKLDLTSCSFSECVSHERGGGIFLDASAEVQLRDSNFSDCTAYQGGAVAVEGSEARVGIEDCKFRNNSAVEGGAILVESASINLEGATQFERNSADRGGAIAAQPMHNSTLPCAISIADGSHFVENMAIRADDTGGRGGAIFFIGEGSLTCGAATFSGNTAPSTFTAGGAIYLYGPIAFHLSGNALFTRNAAHNGGGIHIGGGTQAELRDGPVFSYNAAFSGGGLVIVGQGTKVVAQNRVRFEHNTARFGGGFATPAGPMVFLMHDIEFNNNVVSRFGGGCHFQTQNSLTTSGRVSFNYNHAAAGGGALSLSRFNQGNLTEGTSFTGNTCGSEGEGCQGGAVRVGVSSVMYADKVIFQNNKVLSPVAGSAGGAIVSGNMHLTGCSFARNVAPVAGAILWRGGGAVNSSRFEENVADLAGAVLHSSELPLTLDDNTFFNNSATTHGGCIVSSDASVLHLSNSAFEACRAGNNGAAVFITDQATVHASGVVTMSHGSAGGNGGGIHHQGSLLYLHPSALVTMQENQAAGGGGISSAAGVTIEGQLRVMNNVALKGNGGGVQSVGVYSITTVSADAWLEVADNEAAASNGGGIALLDNARLTLQIPECPATCTGIGDGVCDSTECLTPQCGWDGGDCAELFVDAGRLATEPCERLQDCQHFSIVETSTRCSPGCISSTCEWAFGATVCDPVVATISECPYLNAQIYADIFATPSVRYIAEGGTAGGFGRCESETCHAADASIGRDQPYCTTINDGGRLMVPDCEGCTSASEAGESWGPCAPKETPRLPGVGFDYDPDEMRAIASMSIPNALKRFPGCGYKTISVHDNRAARAGGGVYKDRCDPFLENADRCFVGELDNQRLPAMLIDIADNHAGGPGGGIFSQCSELSACLRAMHSQTGLPERGNASQRLVHFGDRSTSDAYGDNAAGLPVELEITSLPRNHTPGQSMLSLSFRLLDTQHQVLHGSASWPNPHVAEVKVCVVGDACEASTALQPSFLLRMHPTDHHTSILMAAEPLAWCPVGEDQVEVHLEVAGDGDASLHKSAVVACEPCGPGQEKVLDDVGGRQVWTCRSCQPTEYVVTQVGGCKACPLEGVACDGSSFTPEISGAEWAAENATMRVQSCPAGYILVRNPALPMLDACVMCPPGKFSVRPASYPDTLAVESAAHAPLQCFDCVRGADCLGGPDIISEPGFWQDRAVRRDSVADEVVLYQCLPAACEGNNSCQEGRHGPVCGLCDEGWSSSGLTCIFCGDDTAVGKAEYIPSFAIMVVLACIVIYLLTCRPLLEDFERAVAARLCCSSASEDQSDDSIQPTSRLAFLRRNIAGIQWTSPAMIGAFKVAISFYQVASTFNVTFRIAWPDSFNVVASVGRLTGLDLTLLLPSVACVARSYSFVDRLLVFSLAFPGVSTVILCLPYLLTRLLGAIYHGGSKAHPKHDDMQRCCLRAVLLWFFLIYPTVSEYSLSTFLCRDLGSGGHVLVMDTSVDCPWGGSSPSGAFYLALFLVLLFPIGIQAFFYYVISCFFVPAMAEAKYSRALFAELIKLYRRETSTAVTIKLAQHVGMVRRGTDDGAESTASPSNGPTVRRHSSQESVAVSESAVPLQSFKRRVSQLFTQSFVQRELSGAVPPPAVYEKLRHVLEQFGCSDTELVRVVTVLQRLSISTAVGEELDGFEQLALRIADNHFLFTGHETLEDLSMEQLKALFLFDWEGVNRKRSDREIKQRKSRRQQMMSEMDREQLREWVFAKAKELEKSSRVSVPNLTWNGESEEEERALRYVGILFDDFRVQTWWFFLLGEFCKLIMTSVLVFIPGRFWQQLAWGTFVQVCITSLYVSYRPMAEEWLNNFQVFALRLQCAILFFGLLLSVSDDPNGSAFEPWTILLVSLKWAVPFFPLLTFLLGKAVQSAHGRLRRVVVGSEEDREEQEPTFVERLLFPTATNNKARLRRASVASDASATGLYPAGAASTPLGGEAVTPLHAATEHRRRIESIDAQLGSARGTPTQVARMAAATLAAADKTPAPPDGKAESPGAPDETGIADANDVAGPETPPDAAPPELVLSVVPTPRK